MCPECGDPLVALELDGIEIDHCLSCCGTWLDAGELDMIATSLGADCAEIEATLVSQTAQGLASRRCPRCQRRFELVHLGEETKLELDRCPRGHGLWFDRDELQAVVAQGGQTAVGDFFGSMFSAELACEHDEEK